MVRSTTQFAGVFAPINSHSPPFWTAGPERDCGMPTILGECIGRALGHLQFFGSGRRQMDSAGSDSRLRLALDGSSAVQGGGLTYLREVLPRLLEHPHVLLGPVLLREGIAQTLGLRASDYQLRTTATRIGAMARGWRQEVAAAGAEVVFAPTELTFARYSVPLVLAVRNPELVLTLVHDYRSSRSGQPTFKAIDRSAFQPICDCLYCRKRICRSDCSGRARRPARPNTCSLPWRANLGSPGT